MRQLLIKLMNIALIIAVLFQYQQKALVRAEQVAEHNEQLAQAAALEAEYQAMIEQANGQQTQSPYQDGTFQGIGSGFGGDVVLDVTLTNGRIESIALVSATGEDSAYWSQAERLFDTIVQQQSTAVDAVSGATYSSKGILQAVEQALKEAER